MAIDKTEKGKRYSLSTLPGDDIRQVMWRYSDRYDLQMVAQSSRSVARGVVARLVADGERNNHEWTAPKDEMLKAFDDAGITSVFIDPKYGGYLEGPKNLAMSIVAYELSWVDAGAATCSLAGNLALAPIHERGTPEQKARYMQAMVPPQPGENRKIMRGAFALTEPLPYVGVDTGVLCGKVRVVEWQDGQEPILEVEKRGRFITNMDYANFITAAVDSDDKRIKSSCMIILEESDSGVFDRGAPTLKMVHQLSSTRDPIFKLRVPASRIIGGYTVKDGVIIPNYSHGEVIESVFRRTRAPVGLMSSAKLMSAVEPIIRYQRQRFRGGQSGSPGSPRYDLGLQQKDDALQRLIDVWATAEAGTSLGFAVSRLLDEFDAVERRKEEIFKEKGIEGARAQLKAIRALQGEAIEFVSLSAQDPSERDEKRYSELVKDELVQFVASEALTNILVPACKLWNTGYGATMMREAVSLMGGYGITEDCQGFLAQKWVDMQLEATYEGPEAVQRRQLSLTMANEVFLAQVKEWIEELRRIAEQRPAIGACTLAGAFELWLWSFKYLVGAKDGNGKPLYHSARQGVTFALADALCWLVSSRYQMMDVIELDEKTQQGLVANEGAAGFVGFFSDLAHVQAARAAGEAGRICAELIFGYQEHPADSDDGDEDCGCDQECSCSFSGGADCCVDVAGLDQFFILRYQLDRCLSGARMAKERAALALTEVMIPEALDYPR